jgi:hypothetical protein
MARPKNKEELLKQSKDNFDRLNNLIESLPEEQRKAEFPKGMLNRSIRDVLGHLHEWHLMMLQWYEVGMQGEKPAMPAEGYSWKTTPELNVVIQKKYTDHSLSDVIGLAKQSHQKLFDLIVSHTNDELFVKKKYKWTGSTSLGAYLTSATSSHYDWASRLIKKALK